MSLPIEQDGKRNSQPAGTTRHHFQKGKMIMTEATAVATATKENNDVREDILDQVDERLLALSALDKIDPVLVRQAVALQEALASDSQEDRDKAEWLCQELLGWQPYFGMAFRPYQAQALGQIARMLEGNQRGVYQLPTGGGKTHIGIGIALAWLSGGEGCRVVWLTHRKELELQSFQRLIEAGVDEEQVLVISPIKLRNKIKRGDFVATEDDLLVVDECHHAVAHTWLSTIVDWPGRVLGLTATPWRLSKKQGLNEAFQALELGPLANDLVSKWYLAPMDVYAPAEADMIQGKGTATGGDYNIRQTLESQNRTVLVEKGIEWLSEHWERLGRQTRTIVYCIGVKHAHTVAKFAEECGYKAAVLLGETPKEERDGMLARFSAGEFNILCNAEVATEGFDIPAVEIVLVLRPTKSVALYLQMAGRATRPQEGKRAIVLDAAGNCRRLGLPYEPRPWSLNPRGDDGVGEMPTKKCPACGCENSIAARKCRNCGHAFGFLCGACGAWETDEEYLQPSIDGKLRCSRCHEMAQEFLFQLGEDEVTSSQTFLDPQTPLDKLPIASPMKLRDGTWGVWVAGEDAMSKLKPGMYVCNKTKAGKTWKVQIDQVLGKSRKKSRPGVVCSQVPARRGDNARGIRIPQDRAWKIPKKVAK